jgi:chitin synthase
MTPPASSSQSLYRSTAYDQVDDQDLDAGDMPLLRRDPSSMSSLRRVPGGYEDDGDGAATADNQSENNIRYGRIPQRVPRRYKTIKKVE